MAYMVLEKTTGDTCGNGRLPLTLRWRVKEHDFALPLPAGEVVGLQFAEPIPITPQDIANIPNEIRIERTGTCNQCGYCCGWIGNQAADHCCVHVKRTGGNKGSCLIYGDLAAQCTDPTCDNQDDDGSHALCLPAPCMPYHKWNALCGYTWTVTTPGLPITNKEVIRIYFAEDKDLTDKWISE